MKSYIIGAVFFFAVGLFIFLRRQRRLATLRGQIAAAQHWPEANARIDGTGTRLDTSILESLFSILLARGGSFNFPSMTIAYRFDVGGQLYQGDRLAFGRLDPHPRRAREILARYPKGSVTTIRYNPHDPRDNVVVPNELVDSKSLGAIGPMVMGFAFVLIIIGLTK